MPLLDLSLELLEEIGSQLAQTDHANLRTSCKVLSGAMDRLFFSVLNLKTNQLLSANGIQMLETLADGRTGWSLYARTVCIKPGNEAETQEGDDEPHLTRRESMRDLLASALGSMPKISTVFWDLAAPYNSWPWERKIIYNFLNTLSALDTLELNIQGVPDLSSLHVWGLRKFTVKSPNLPWRGSVFGMNPAVPAMYQEVAQLVSQNRLSSLHLEGSGEWSAVWRMLQTGNHDSDSRTKLTEITTSVVTQDLLAYLASYSGIRKLALKAPDGGSRVQSDRLADMFFEAVLPRHGTTLTDLSCPAAYESRFSFGEHNAHFVSLLHNLSSLEMSINAGAVRRVDPPTEWVDADGVHHRLVSVGISIEVEQADIDPVVALLLETAAALPTLRRLAIAPAETERNRGAKCGNGRMHHQSAVCVAIAHAVRAFRSDVPCAAVVRATAAARGNDGISTDE
ncbi:hypothetical protein DFH08DRAFT_801737 [Mycena albidolilacea]|uniref:F-box domain-containing protein n=1 Tax=Mycena albidolilacea TaxID=1033008 RepID=A0AAD7AJ85_9AGAR|nr:hypothetical protein DFH08DRAFT_801737 [Mycena albidolilacea]